MDTLEALYFPGTTIYSASQFPTFLLFDTIHLLRPVEAAEGKEDTADIFISTGRCQEHTPSPLGKNRDRFLRLVNDIRDRKDDYAAQLGNLTLASLSARKSSIDDSTRGIVASLLTAHGVEAGDEEQPDETLWQARLVLKIAEILDIEEEEVAMQLALLDDREENLFQELQGELAVEEESLLEELQQLQRRISKPSAGTVKNRLNAWTRLRQTSANPRCRLWLTHLEEAADILIEQYEKTRKEPPPILITLSLPANLGWSRGEAAQHISDASQRCVDLRRQLAEALGQADKEQLAELARVWETQLDQVFPAESFGRCALVIYDFSAASCSSLLGQDTGSGVLLGVVANR